MVGQPYVYSYLALMICFVLATAAPIRLSTAKTINPAPDLTDRALPSEQSWTPFNIALLTTTAIACMTLVIVDAVNAWKDPPHTRLNDGLTRRLRHVFQQDYVALLLILFGFCFDVARAADVPPSKTGSSSPLSASVSALATVATPSSNHSLRSKLSNFIHIANPFPWDVISADQVIVNWLQSAESNWLFSFTTVIILFGTLDRIYCILRWDDINGPRATAANWSVGVATIVRVFHSATMVIMIEPGRPRLYLGAGGWTSFWLGLTITTGFFALAIGFIVMASVFARALVEGALPELLPANLLLANVPFLIVGSMFMDVTNAGHTKDYGSINTFEVAWPHAGGLSSSNSGNQLTTVIAATERHFHADELAIPTGLPELLVVSGKWCSTLPTYGKGLSSNGSTRSWRGEEEVPLLFGFSIIFNMLCTTMVLVRRFYSRDIAYTKLAGVVCLCATALALTTSNKIVLEESHRQDTQLSETGWGSLVMGLGTAAVIFTFALAFEGLVRLGWLEYAEERAQLLLPRAIHLDYLIECTILGSVFMDVVDATEISSQDSFDVSSTTALLHTAGLPTLVPQALTPLPPHATCGNTLGLCSTASRSATPIAKFGIVPNIWIACVMIFTIWILFGQPRVRRLGRLASKAVVGTIASGLLYIVANALEHALSTTTSDIATSTSRSFDVGPETELHPMPGIWLACAIIFSIWILLPVVRGFHDSGSALGTAIGTIVAGGAIYTLASAVQTALPVATDKSNFDSRSSSAVAPRPATGAATTKAALSFWLVVAVILVLATTAASAIHGVVPGRAKTSTITVPGPTRTSTVTVTSIRNPARDSAVALERSRSWHRACYGRDTFVTSASPVQASRASSEKGLKPVAEDDPNIVPKVKTTGTNPGVTRLAILLALFIFAAVLIPTAFASPVASLSSPKASLRETTYNMEQGRTRLIDRAAKVHGIVPVAGGATLTVEDFDGATSTWIAGTRVQSTDTRSS